METLYYRAIHCLCSCLIKKQSIHYTEVNDENSKFMPAHDHCEDQQRTKSLNLPENSLSEKMQTYFQEGDHKSEPSINKDVIQHRKEYHGSHEEESLLKLQDHSVKDYIDVMSPEHPYYHLFKDKLIKLTTAFELPSTVATADPDTLYPLKLHCYQESKNNVFVYFFKFPTDIDTYQSISNDFELQKKFDSNIEEFKKQFEVLGGDAKLMYLSYKKVLMMASRDFEYVKYAFKRDKEHWSICVSDLTREEITNKVRGEMILTATRILEVEGYIEVSVYSQIDMKIPIKLEMAKNRGFAEIRKYLDKVYNHIKNSQKRII